MIYFHKICTAVEQFMDTFTANLNKLITIVQPTSSRSMCHNMVADLQISLALVSIMLQS